MTHNEMILLHMQTRGGITSMEAFEEYGCTRLSARIKNLRDAGHHIDTIPETSRNRLGKKVCYARYVIRDA